MEQEKDQPTTVQQFSNEAPRRRFFTFKQFSIIFGACIVVLVLVAGGMSVYAYDRVSRTLDRVQQATDVRAGRVSAATVRSSQAVLDQREASTPDATIEPTAVEKAAPVIPAPSETAQSKSEWSIVPPDTQIEQFVGEQPPATAQPAAIDVESSEQSEPAPTSTPAPIDTMTKAPAAEIEQPFTVLVIGVDVRDDDTRTNVRADTLMLLRVDPRDRSAALLSLPRDTLVTIPSEFCAAQQKINAAYACGYAHPSIYGADVSRRDAGAALAAETVENFLGVPVDYTAQINFAGFVDVVDALGGVTVDVPRAIEDPAYPTADYGTMHVSFPKGRQTMDGETALQYVRTRHADSDFGRAARQQQVVVAILRQLKQQNILQQIGSVSQLLDIAGETVRTTLPVSDMDMLRGFAGLANDLGNDRIERLVLRPQRNENGSLNLRMAGTAIEWKAAYVRDVVQQFLGESQPLKPETAGGRSE